MKSKAAIKSHPLHPMLIAFPAAFLPGALLFDLLSLATGNEALRQTACYLDIAGILGGLAAAVPGAIDLYYVVPPQSSARKRGIRHALVNITALCLFALALLLRRDADSAFGVILALESAGLLLIVAGGWLGGTLVYRNQIAVDGRYAFAGKWKEMEVPDRAGRHPVADSGELQRDGMKLIRAGSRRVVLGLTESGYVAFDDRCPHRGGSLAGGALICGTVQCPWHGSQFSVTTGQVKAGPAREGIRTYEVQEEGGKVYLVLPPQP